MTRRPSPTFQVLRQNRLWISRFLAVFMALWQIGQPLQAATFYWDADTTDSGNTVDGIGLGGTGAWDTATSNWWPIPAGPLTIWGNTSSDIAIFSGSYALPPTLNTVTLSTGITANQLRFERGGYTLTGGDLTLAGTTPTLYTSMGESATVESQLLGSAGLTKTGGGSVRLTNALNSYTGATSIRNGSLIINSEAALGGTGAVSILSTNSTPLNTASIGFGGGSLVLDGTAGGFTFSRAINFEGRGPIGDRGAAIQSLGNNTLSGTLTSAVSPLPLSPTASLRSSRINSVNGTLTISGTLNVGGTLGTTITSLGGVNTAGVGNFSFAGGTIAGTGTLEKSGSGVLDLNGNASTFTGAIRTAASSIGQQSSVRVTQTTVGGTSVFGASTASGTSAPIDLNGGVLEFRSNSSLDFNALATGKNVYLRANTVVYTGPAGSGDVVNGLTTLGLFRVAANTTATFRSRNGFGATLQAWTQESSNNNTAIANEMGGTLTFTGDAWNNADAATRDLTFSGNGNTRIVGNITATGTSKRLIKQGTGELILNGTAGTFTGGTFIQGGAVRITDFRSINNDTLNINLGNATTTAGALIIGGTGTGTATSGGLTTSKPILWNVTTAQSAIYANQAAAFPVTLNGAITTVLTTGNYNLGGSSTQDNIINSALPLAGTGGLTKVGAGTWVLNAANLYTGATNIQAGTLKLRATAAASNVIQNAGAIVFSAQGTAQTAGGTLEFRGVSTGVTTETLGALTPTAGAGTVRLLGQGGFASNLTFTSLGATTAASSVNFDTTGATGGVVTLTGQVATTAINLPGTANFQGHLYINGADFATTTAAGVVQAPTYAAAGSFQNAGAALVASVHNKLTAGFTQVGATTTISSLVTNNQALTLGGDLVVSTGGILQSGGTASILSDSATARLIQGGGAATNVAIRVNLLADVLNLGNATNPVIISSVTTGGLTKNGAGTLNIFGTNLQTGTTTINEGKVSLNGAAARLSAAASNLVVRQGATLELLAGVTDANAVVNNVDGVGTISGQSGQTFTQNGTGTWNGVYSGTGFNITKGGGAATWSGVSTYTGVTTIGGTGLVTVDTMANGGVNSGIGASSNAASNLVFTGSTAAGIDYRGNINDTALTLGSRSATTDRLFTLAAAATGANLTSSASNNNAIVWSNTGAIVNNTTANATLTLAGASTGDNTLNPQLVDSSVGGGITLAVTKSGAGQWNLGNASNSYTGLTTVSDGILGLNINAALPTNSPLVLGAAATSGILQMSGSFARTLSTTPTAGTGTITWGGTTGSGGFAAHSSALTVTLNSGAALTWGSGGFVGTGGVQTLILNSVSSLADVTFTNDIDLGNAARTVTVNDNAQTGADYANLTGVLSGTGGGLFKNGAGILRVGNQNSYTGITSVDAGTLVVSSLGSSTAGVTSSVGAGTVTMDDTNAIVLGNATTTGGGLQYVGPGETSDRKIRLRGTTANSAIYADGAGPLILTNVAHDTTETGNKTLSLRGTNTGGNMITSVLSNNVAGVLTVSVDGGAAWILTNAGNTYTGGTSAGAGALGIGDDLALGTGSLTNTNGNVFAYGADRTLANALAIPNNVSSGWLGDYSLTVGGITTLAAAANNITFNNSIVAGKALTLNGGVIANALTANRAWIIDGPGETVINGNFTTSTAFGVRFDVNGGGTLTLGTNGATSNFNQTITAVDVDRGSLKFTTNNSIPTTFAALTPATTAGTAISATTYTVGSTAGLVVGQVFTGTNVPAGSKILTIDSPTTFTTTVAPTAAVASGVTLTFSGSGGVTLTPELATNDTARIDLNGTTQTFNAFTATSDGISIIDNSAAGAATLIVGANNTAATFGTGGTGTYSVTQTGGGAINLTKIGTNTANFTGTLGNTGTVTSNGGVLNLNSATSATGAVGDGGTVNFKGGITTPGNLTTVITNNGGLVSFASGSGTPFNSLTTLDLSLTANSGLELDVGDSGTDKLTSTLASVANVTTLFIKDTDITGGMTYDLIVNAGGGLGVLGNYLLNLPGYSGSTLTVTPNLVQLNAGTLVTSDVYWNNGTGLGGGTLTQAWNTVDPTTTNINFSGVVAGTPALQLNENLPGKGQKVIFQGDNITGGAPLATTLEQAFTVNTLEFRQSTTATDTSRTISIAPGAVGSNSLTAKPTLATDGINLQTGAVGTVSISAPFVAGANQTWTVADAAVESSGGVIAAGTPTILDMTSTTGMRAGMTITGTGIPAGTTIVSVNSPTQVTLSTSATAGTALQITAVQQLNMSGALSGSGNVTKAGAGRVVLSGANGTLAGTYTNSAGSTQVNTLSALGGLVGIPGSGTDITVTGGSFYYNGAAATFVNDITLNGGALSGGGGNHTYSGSVNVSGNSFINMADSGGSALNTARNITLSGVVSGSGNLTIDSNSGLGGGNQLNGTLTLNNAANTWSGDLFFNEGTVTLANTVSPGFTANDVTFNAFGRFNLQGLNGATLTRTGTINYLGGAIGELGVDNTGAVVNTDFLVDQSGLVTLGAAGTGGNVRIFLADAFSKLSITGGVLLGGNSSISVGGDALGVATISSVISDGGSGFSLAVNDDFGGWGTTNRTLRLTGLNTFTGNVDISEGVLQFDTATNVSGAASSLGQGTALTIGAATLSYIGGVSQSTDRPITQINAAAPTTALTSILAANGTGGATMTYTGAITGGIHSLTLEGTGDGNLNGVVTQSGNATADLTKAGTGTWNLNATNVIVDDLAVNLGTLNVNVTQQVADDFVVTGGATPTIVNLNAANSHQGDDMFIRSGATVNLGINGAFSNNATNGMDALNIGDSGTNNATLDLKGFTGNTVNAATIGLENTIDGYIIDTVGGGSISSTGWVVRNGAASATLAGATLAKNGAGNFTLSGNNTFTGATTVTEGQLILDYSTNNTSKIAAAAGVTIGGAAADANPTLTLNGNASAPTTQAFTVLTVSPGSGNIVVNSNGGQAANLNFTTITRTVGGTIDLTLPAVGNITSTQALTNGILGGYSTLTNGASFVSKDGSNNLVAPTLASKNDVLTWLATDNVTDTAGYTNSLIDCVSVNSITFTAAGSTVNATGRFGINSGGVLVTNTSTGAGISGGSIVSSSNDLIVHQYAAGDFTVSSSIRGINGVTKTGTGALVLSGNNTSTGAVTITEGLVKVSGGNAIGDGAPVNLKDVAGSGLQLLSSETIGNLAGGGAVGGNIALGSNTLTVNQTTNLAYSGTITGSGALVKQGTANLNLNGASSSFNGPVIVNQGLLQASGANVSNLPSISSLTVNTGGAFLVDNNGSNPIPDRVNNAAGVTLSSLGGGGFFGVHIRGDQEFTTNETFGTLTLAGGSSGIAANQNGGTGRTTILTFASLVRQDNATIFLNGRNLAVTSGNNRGRITFTTAPTLVGGAGVAQATTAVTNVPIIRFAVSLQNTAQVALTDVPNTFASYNANGVVPLNLTTEYRLDSAGYAASADVNDNLRFTTGATGLVTKTFNAAVFDASTAAMTLSGLGGGTNVLTVNSGAMLFTSTVLANGTTLDGFDSITPGAGSSNEWVITTANTTATINSILSNGAGATTLTKSGTGTLILGSANTYTGPTVLNQGIVRATNDSNLGVGGGLNFFGGTLQFGGVFDPSARVITFNSSGGGATFDTDVNNIVIANPIGNAGAGSLTKTGTGSLTINAPATHTGGLIVTNGSLIAGVADMQPAGRNITVNGAAAILDVSTFNQSVGTLTLVNGAVNGAATITATDYQLQAGTVSNTVVLAGNTVTKTTAGVATLSGLNTFTGQVAVQVGTLSFDSIANADGTLSALGAPTTAVAGAIQMGLGASAAALTYTGSGHATNRTIDLVGATGSSTINANGTGALVLNGAITSEEYGAKSIVLAGTSAGAIINKVTVPITECFGVLTLQKAGSNTWQLDATNTYTGATQLDDGKLTIAAVQNLTGGLTLGSTNAVTTAGTLDITANTTFGGPMVVQTNSASNINHLNIAAGSTLTVNNNVTIGSSAGNSTTLLDSSGGGTFNVTNPAANGIFAVGGNTATGNQTIADLGGLGSVAIALDPTTGIVRVNPNNATNIAAKDSTLILPSTGAGTTTITANILAVGDGGQNASATQLNKVKLGSGLNTLNVNTVNIGTGGRDIGEISFNGPTGSVILRAADGVSRVAFNMGTGAATTGVAGVLGNTFDVTGHNADLLLGAVNIGTQNRNSDLLNTFAFNQGTLDMTSLNASSKGANGNNTTTNINLGGGTVTSGAWTLASNTGPGTAVANANITGGVVTLSGNISRGVNTGAGTATATVTLAGGTLNMGGNNIGSLTAPVTFVAQSGSVSGLAELNGGGALTKTTSGTLIMRAGNNYTGATNVSDGTLQVGVGGVGTTGTGLVTAVKASATYTNAPIISGSGSINGAVVIGDTVTAGNRGILAPGDGNTTTSNATLTITAAGGLTIAAGSQTQLGITAASGTDVAFALSGLSASAYLASLGSTSDASLTTPAAWANQPTSGQADFIKINNGAGALVLGTNGGGAAATQGIVSIFSNGLNTGSLAAGQIFNLVDWFGTFSGGFNLGSGLTQGGIYGDFDLPDISMTSFNWDTSAFKSHGVIAVVGVVPEPSRAMLMLLGLLALGFRRRRIQD